MNKIIFNKTQLLASLILLGVIFTMAKCQKPKPDPVNPPDPPIASTLKINSFNLKSGSVTKTEAGFDFSTSSNKTILIQSIIDSVNNKIYDVLNKTTFTVDNLTPSKDFPFTLYVKDASGKEQKQSLTVHTLDKASSWVKAPVVSYGQTFAIVGNAQSNKLSIQIENTSSVTKTLKSLKANFGENGTAVKMLRYKSSDSRWTKSMATGNTGEVEIREVVLQPGMNNLEAYFSLKKDVGGVANGKALTLQFTSLDDGEGAKLPVGGSFQSPINVGSVDANTEPTEIVENKVTFVALLGNIIASTHGSYSQISIFSLNFKVQGPAGARIHSLRLKNPWWTFQGLEFDPNGWRFDDNRMDGSPYETITNFVWEAQNKFVTLNFSNLDYSKIVSDGNKYNGYNIRESIRNNSNVIFDTENYTPGESSFLLDSKYDIIIYNASGQVVDMSDLTVYKLYQVYLTD